MTDFSMKMFRRTVAAKRGNNAASGHSEVHANSLGERSSGVAGTYAC